VEFRKIGRSHGVRRQHDTIGDCDTGLLKACAIERLAADARSVAGGNAAERKHHM
jgi:hypothetical protein